MAKNFACGGPKKTKSNSFFGLKNLEKEIWGGKYTEKENYLFQPCIFYIFLIFMNIFKSC